MKFRSVQVPRSVLDIELMLQQPEVRRARDDYAAFLRGEVNTEPRLWGFDPEVVEAIYRLARLKNGDDFDERQFVRKMRETRPLAVQPRVTERALDLWRTLAQQEILQELWPSLDPRTGSRGRHPGMFAKAFLFSTAALGHSAHLNANHDLLCADRRLRAVFAWIEDAAAALSGMKSQPFMPQTYEQTLRQMHAIAERLPMSVCIETNIRLVKEIHKLLGVKKVRLGIDGTLMPAHVEQIGRRPAEREAEICRVAKNAKPRLIEGRDGAPRRFVRGYYLIAIVDLTTGLPLVWVLWPADADEAKALKHLLYTLYQQWPDLPALAIVADGAWNENWAAEWCLRNFGLHLIAPRQEAQRETRHDISAFDSELISAYYGDGQAICRKHGVPMIRDGYQGASRRGLQPGDAAPANKFRLRYHCPIDSACGRPGLGMKEHLTALSYYPHSLAAGRSDLHAERLAMEARRNSCEALFSALQLGNKLGLDGAARTRTAKEPTVEALLSIALMQRSAFMLADLRIQRGLFRDDVPPDLARALAL